MTDAADQDHIAASLGRAAQTMDRLRSPGGCPWDAEQTHASLAPYLLEEAYETLDAIESGDVTALREELGDLLLQVLFHARLAEEEEPGFNIGDVSDDLVAKLVRRHPHVFAEVSADSAEQVAANWDEIKKAEKQRDSATDGIALGQPALSLTEKLIGRSRLAGLDVPPPAGDGIGERLFAVVAEAVAQGVDAELALREVSRRYRDAITRAEGSADR
jgi:XTP/dITP diphosphohydrolase